MNSIALLATACTETWSLRVLLPHPIAPVDRQIPVVDQSLQVNQGLRIPDADNPHSESEGGP